MKVISVLGITGALVAATNASAQGAVHSSNLQHPTIGSLSVGSDAWFAVWFETGSVPGGYVLDSIELSMDAPSGSPSGFGVMLWDFAQDRSIAELSGPDPLTGGVFGYASSGFVLSPSTVYWVAVTSATAVADGAFNWNYKSSGFVYTNGWTLGGVYNSSTDGLEWSRTQTVGSFQFAANATPIPEPSVLALAGVVGLWFGIRFWKRGASKGSCN
jgi:hypothetical protein